MFYCQFWCLQILILLNYLAVLFAICGGEMFSSLILCKQESFIPLLIFIFQCIYYFLLYHYVLCSIITFFERTEIYTCTTNHLKAFAQGKYFSHEHFMLLLRYTYAKVQPHYGLCIHKHVCMKNNVGEVHFHIHATVYMRHSWKVAWLHVL